MLMLRPRFASDFPTLGALVRASAGRRPRIPAVPSPLPSPLTLPQSPMAMDSLVLVSRLDTPAPDVRLPARSQPIQRALRKCARRSLFEATPPGHRCCPAPRVLELASQRVRPKINAHPDLRPAVLLG